ncbi:hypothetical protein FRC96_09560 [Lujinxingia vulgaris]|uniref:Uncharacterized protein n=1 Tax=Lujinxingia vulgaris TaxID=2600176 RepID=A0A5C6X5A0_9DELT|nr:hypothetical protein [Lujinxingia vulgaris]TXD36318.1 hypothetical protein FRC96_09560 [Lujinxingia vulgaris]
MILMIVMIVMMKPRRLPHALSRTMACLAMTPWLLAMLGACAHPAPPPAGDAAAESESAEERVEDALLSPWVLSPDVLSDPTRQGLLEARCQDGEVTSCIYAGALAEHWESLRSYCAMGAHDACAILGTYAPYDATMADAHEAAAAHILYRTLTLARPADAPGELDTDVRQALYDATVHTDDPLIRRQMNFFGHRALLGRCQAALDRLEVEPGNQDAAAMAGNLCGYALDAMNATSVMVEDDAFTVAALAETSRIYGRLARAIDAMLPANAARASGEAADADERVAQYYENSDEAYARAAEVMKACRCGHWALIEDFVR